MSHKVHPIGYRLGINTNWSSRWFDMKNYPQKLKEDTMIREFLTKKLRGAGLERVEIERTADKILIVIHTSRPGLIIGRAGTGVEDLNKRVEKVLRNARKTTLQGLPQIKLDVKEIRNSETYASLVGLSIAEQIEKRMPFRRVMKRAIERTMANQQVKGVKIVLSGRLGGSEMARTEWLKEGVMPRSTIRAHIDFSIQVAYTIYGTIGIRVWIYKGQKFD